jgi:fatty-acyl-CoA synthase
MKLRQSKHVTITAIGEDRHLLATLTGRSQIVCDSVGLTVFRAFGRARSLVEAAGELGLSGEALSSIVQTFVRAGLLLERGTNETAQIRALFPGDGRSSRSARSATRRAGPGETARPGGALREHASSTAPSFTAETTLVLSSALVRLAVTRTRQVVRHPLDRPLHLESALWRVAELFREPAALETARRRLSPAPDRRDFASICAFLVSRSVLWSSTEAEREIMQRELSGLTLRHGVASVARYTAAEREFPLYRAVDVPRVQREHTVVIIGACHTQAYVPTFLHLAQISGRNVRARTHETLAAAGGDLRAQRPSLVIVSLATRAFSFYEALALGDTGAAMRETPAVIAAFDAEIEGIRAHTGAPILVHSLGRSGLPTSPPMSTASREADALLTDLNGRLSRALRQFPDVFLLNEDRVVARNSGPPHWNDDLQASWHHAPRLPEVPVPRGRVRGSRASSPLPLRPTADPLHSFARAYLDFLALLDEEAPVALVVFEPDQLLWPGYLQSAGPLRRARAAWASPGQWFHTGINEALRVLLRRGIALACLSRSNHPGLLGLWRSENSRTAINYEDLAFAYAGQGPRECLDEISRQSGIREEQMLYVDLCRPAPRGFRGRVYAGQPRHLREYLCTAPELNTCHLALSGSADDRSPPRGAPARRERSSLRAGSPEIDPLAVRERMRHLIAAHLGRPAGEIAGSDDLRLFGLDSLGAAEVRAKTEREFNTSLRDHDYSATVMFSLSGLTSAVIRALRSDQQAARSPRLPVSRRGNIPAPDRQSWIGMDVADIIRKNCDEPRSGWILKIVHSPGRFDHQYVTWKELHALSAGYALMYQATGLAPGSVITALLPSGKDLVAAIVGAWIGGFVPSVCAYPNEKLSTEAFAQWFPEIVHRSHCRLVLCEAALEHDLRHLGNIPEDTLVTSAVPRPHSSPLKGLPRPRGPDCPVLLQHSSGTTGLKKAVLLTNRQVLAQIWELARSLRCDDEDVIVSWLPLYHDMGLISSLMVSLLCSVPLVLMSPFVWVNTPSMFLRQISEERGTLCWLPNFAYLHLAKRVRDDELEDLDLSSLRAAINCSEPITAEAQRSFLAAFQPHGLRRSALSSSYAMAEATFAVTQSPVGRSSQTLSVDRAALQEGRVQLCPGDRAAPGEALEIVSSGRVLPGFTLEVVDGNEQLLGEGQVGEIRVQGPSVVSGYFDGSDGSSAAMRDGWYYTGDLGARREGEIYVTGRKKDMVIVAGKNLYPQYVEELVSSLEGVRPGRVVAFGVFAVGEGTERLVVLAEATGGTDWPQPLGALIAQAIQVRFQVAADVRIVLPGALRKSTSGKISRAANKELYTRLLREQAGDDRAAVLSAKDRDANRLNVSALSPEGATMRSTFRRRDYSEKGSC